MRPARTLWHRQRPAAMGLDSRFYAGLCRFMPEISPQSDGWVRAATGGTIAPPLRITGPATAIVRMASKLTDAAPYGQRVGEVIAAHTERIEAQCYVLYAAPPLGALLRIGAPPVYAVTRAVWHAPLDPTRPLAVRGAGLETEAEIYAANPQLESMLTTRFAAAIVGYEYNNSIGYGGGPQIRAGLPDAPPPLHSFVWQCDSSPATALASQPQFYRLLLAEGTVAADLALAALLRQAGASSDDRRGFLVRAGRMLAAELAQDTPRLHTILGELAGSV